MKEPKEINFLDYLNDTDDKMTYDGSSDIAITFQLGAQVASTVEGAKKFDNVSAGGEYITLATVPAANVSATPTLLFIDLQGTTNYEPSAYMRLKFSDGTNEKISEWRIVEYLERATLFVKLEDLTLEIGIDAFIQGV